MRMPPAEAVLQQPQHPPCHVITSTGEPYTALQLTDSPLNTLMSQAQVSGTGRIVTAMTATVPCDHELAATVTSLPACTQPSGPRTAL